MVEIRLLLATFLLVFMRVAQSQNVIHKHYVLAGITPYFIAVGEVATVLWVVDNGWYSIPFVGTGGAVGAVLSMYVFNKWVRNG
jgi:hypothetical protein